MHAVTSQTVTATAVRNNRSTSYEVEYEGATYTRITFREYRWASIVERRGHRWAEWSTTNSEALNPADLPAGAHVVAVVLLAQPE